MAPAPDALPVSGFQDQLDGTVTLFPPTEIFAEIGRGPPDGPASREVLASFDRCHHCVFLTPPWAEIYVTDCERQHGLVEAIPEFIELYPEIALDLDFSDRIVDLIEEGVDIAIRSGDLPDSRLMTRALRPFQLLLCAAPAYLERHGTPRCPRDLAGHSGIAFRYPNSGKLQDWPLRRPKEEPEPRIHHLITCNNMEALCGAVVRGLGIGCMPDFLVAAPLRSGALVPILMDHLEMPGQFNLIWPSSRHLSPKIRVLVDFLGQRLFSAECPPTEGEESSVS